MQDFSLTERMTVVAVYFFGLLFSRFFNCKDMGHNRVPNKESDGFLWDTSARPKLNRTQHLEKIKRSNQLIDLLMGFSAERSMSA